LNLRKDEQFVHSLLGKPNKRLSLFIAPYLINVPRKKFKIPQKLVIALRTRWAIIWTTVTVVCLGLDAIFPATINCPSPPLPFALFPHGYHSVSLENSAGRTVWTLGGSTASIMPLILDTKIPSAIPETSDAVKLRWRIMYSFAGAIKIV